ncbi:hypothetical protein F0562_015478 [Nyssa sinensis]|uniref:Uncharacterized protein n=1 Tax=Nyssa sinensis TaxID=561372 RepID=A0A5J4ZJM0_9ASTE|nr:hypothetical protein F0562_015478 [Nyssa sinensis]
MASTFLSGVVSKTSEHLASLAAEEIMLAWNVEGELQRLKDTSSSIEAVLLDAEERQWNSRAVSVWLSRLQDIVRDISIVVDDIATEALRRQVEVKNHITEKVTRFLPQLVFQFQMGHKIKGIRKRLDEIFEDAIQFNFIRRDNEMPVMTRGRETYSYVRQSEVVGRHNDTEIIVRKLLGASSNSELSVIAIVGIGGLGKTTLAKLVYGDERVEGHFELKKWVHVSTNFNLKKIIAKISGNQDSNLDLETLQNHLLEELNRKKFLVVLDDVWITNRNEWIELRNLLMVGAKGSKILITTRLEIVANIVGSVPYILQGLSDDESSSLFVKCAFEEGKDNEHPNLIAIGKEIVKKCKGVPLAISTLGGMLFSKTEEKYWFSVLKNEIWRLEDRSEDGIMHVLRLSFDQLPSHMKRCFSYSAIFPKGESPGQGGLLCKEELIWLWMAQGYIQSEDIGNQYFNELSTRSFFNDVEEDDSLQRTFCNMHDLIHDLARSVLGEEFCDIDFSAEDIPQTVRHVFLSNENITRPNFPESLLKLKNLETFIWLCGNCYTKEDICIDPIILSFRYLRVLNLCSTCFGELPRSIKQLKYLRYLHLGGNTRIQRLPNSICNLYNMQTLILEGATLLQELPKDIWKLISLRHLFVTSRQVLFPEKGIGCLTSLRTLSIIECEHLAYLPNSMQNLTALEDLLIVKCSELCFSENDMQGLNNLQRLSIRVVPKLARIPSGLKHAATTLKCLYIADCLDLETLPEWLGSFTSLKRLSISKCPNLTSLPQGMCSLTNLQVLKIRECPGLTARCKKGIGKDWPKIAHIPKISLDEDEDVDKISYPHNAFLDR